MIGGGDLQGRHIHFTSINFKFIEHVHSFMSHSVEIYVLEASKEVTLALRTSKRRQSSIQIELREYERVAEHATCVRACVLDKSAIMQKIET